MTDDGGRLSLRLAEAFQAWGWSVVLLRFPPSVVPATPGRTLPGGVSAVTFDTLEPEAFHRQLETLAQQHDPVGAFIHLHPRWGAPDELYGDPARSLLKAVFMTATHLGPALKEAATEGRSLFAAVTRMDGASGLAEDADFDPLGGGFSGLVKTLRLEWSSVFCRAMDIDPTYAVDRAAEVVLDELQDPNRRLVEVGWRAEERVMLEALEED